MSDLSDVFNKLSIVTDQNILRSSSPPPPLSQSFVHSEFILKSNFSTVSYDSLNQFISHIHNCSIRLNNCQRSEIHSIFMEYLSIYNIKTDNDILNCIQQSYNQTNSYINQIQSFIYTLKYRLKQHEHENIFDDCDKIHIFVNKLNTFLQSIKNPIFIKDNISAIYDTPIIRKLNELYLKANFYEREDILLETPEENALFSQYLSNYNSKEVCILNLIEILIDIEKYIYTSPTHQKLYNNLELKITKLFTVPSLYETATSIMSTTDLSKYSSSQVMYRKMTNIISQKLLIYDNFKTNKLHFEDQHINRCYNKFKTHNINNMNNIIYLLLYVYTTYCNKERIDPRTVSLSEYIKSILEWNTDIINNNTSVDNINSINIINKYIIFNNIEIGNSLL